MQPFGESFNGVMRLFSFLPYLSKISICGLGIALMFQLGCSKERDTQILVVGMELSYPPFEMTDENNKPTGISVEMAQALANRLGKNLRIENIPFAGLIPALKTGKIDLIISSMTHTEERAQSISFSNPYLHTGLCVLVSQSGDSNSIEDIDQFGAKVAVKQGTTGHIYANANLKKAEILIFDKESAASLEVAQGKVDAFIYDQISIYLNWKKHSDTTRALLNPINSESWSIGIRKGNDGLATQVNQFLADYEASGGFDQLGDKYLSEQKAEFKKLGFPFFF
tara:strand:- start:1761 stop:2606 length:846 start_codon:yes stop_codon:yes gene_type:complete